MGPTPKPTVSWPRDQATHLSADSMTVQRGSRHQVRSQPSPVPARPPRPFTSPLVQASGHIACPSRASVPALHAWLGRNVVAVSGSCRQTECLVTSLPIRRPWLEHQILRLVLCPSAPRPRLTGVRFGSDDGALALSCLTVLSSRSRLPPPLPGPCPRTTSASVWRRGTTSQRRPVRAGGRRPRGRPPCRPGRRRAL
jgi:hypothetical protein